MASGHGIVILDFGAQYSQLIARRVREHHVHSVLVPYSISVEALRQLNPAGVILSGGPSSVFDEGAPHSDPAILEMGVPVLGICYGLQLISEQMGGKVRPAPQREYGRAQLEISRSAGSRLFRAVPSPLPVWNSHGDHVAAVPTGFKTTGKTENAISVIENPQAKQYAVEFHPEVRHTDRGSDILKNFVHAICGIQPNWFPRSFIEETVGRVHAEVGGGRALCALSGGVDSAVAATLVAEPIEPDARFGSSLAAADVTGDGRKDLVVGAPGPSGGAGRVYVFAGSSDAAHRPVARRAAAVLAARGAGPARFGAALATAGIHHAPGC